MSRYVVNLGDNKEFVYGFDHSLGYFYELWDNSLGEEDYERIVEDQSYFLNKLSKADMFLTMKKYHARKDHLEKVAIDLPF